MESQSYEQEVEDACWVYGDFYDSSEVDVYEDDEWCFTEYHQRRDYGYGS